MPFFNGTTVATLRHPQDYCRQNQDPPIVNTTPSPPTWFVVMVTGGRAAALVVRAVAAEWPPATPLTPPTVSVAGAVPTVSSVCERGSPDDVPAGSRAASAATGPESE